MPVADTLLCSRVLAWSGASSSVVAGEPVVLLRFVDVPVVRDHVALIRKRLGAILASLNERERLLLRN